MKLTGLGVSNGIGLGKAVVLKENNFDVSKKSADPALETKRFEESSKKLCEILENTAKRSGAEQAEILESHVTLINDPFIGDEIKKLLQNESCNAEYAIETIFNQCIEMFEMSGDDLLMARSIDLKDIKGNLLTVLSGETPIDVSTLEKGSILVARELTTSVAAAIDSARISAIVTTLGGKNSHMAIIARSIGIPAIVGIPVDEINNDDELIVDGGSGDLLISPEKEITKLYIEKIEAAEKRKKELEKFRGQKSITNDGRHIELCANIGMEMDIANAVNADAEGVGLFRTEFLYMNGNSAPNEEMQFSVYKKAAEAFNGNPVIIRTLDIGGDKEIPYLGLAKEENPFLGWRAIRYCLDQEALFKVQLSAILRASAFGNIKIMIPMIATVEEFLSAKRLIDEVKNDLRKNEIAFNEKIEIGMMIETPAAALSADILAKEADFFSIGSNDLTQYIMAADRGNDKVEKLYSVYYPAVLRSIYNIAKAANDAEIPCGICGESACDPLLVKFLIGCGISELSMVSGEILAVREMVLNSNYEKLKSKVSELFSVSNHDQAVDFLKSL